MLTVYINGRFLSQSTTGVQRHAIEVVMAMDRILSLPDAPGSVAYELLVPPNAHQELPLSKIRVSRVGHLRGHAWEQLELASAARRGTLINLGNTGPLGHTRQVVTIHDAGVFANPANFSFGFRTWYKVLIPRVARRATSIFTVSNFSKQELVKYCGIPEEKIRVIHNGADHIVRDPADESIIDVHGLVRDRYLLCMGAGTPNKNNKLILDALEIVDNPDIQLVRLKAANLEIFARSKRQPSVRLLDLDYVTDAQLRALYQNAGCFVFPSLYEGFGIPPLEAMTCGCPVIVARSSALPEICGDAALYCDPFDARDLSAKIDRILNDADLRKDFREVGRQHARSFTWEHCAEEMMSEISRLFADGAVSN